MKECSIRVDAEWEGREWLNITAVPIQEFCAYLERYGVPKCFVVSTDKEDIKFGRIDQQYKP